MVARDRASLPEYCNQAYAKEASLAVAEHAREDLALHTLAAIVSPDNVPSVKLIEKLGLSFERMITMPGDEQAVCLYRMLLTKE